MNPTVNIYCDESCHLEHDGQQCMVLGAIWCPKSEVPRVNQAIYRIKARNGASPGAEAKWVCVSPSKLNMYTDLVEFFFQEPVLQFRALVIPDKGVLDYSLYKQTHDDWYYRMYYEMLSRIMENEKAYEIYLDIKDSLGRKKAELLRQILCRRMGDPSLQTVKRIQIIRSHEVQIVQLVDVILGAIAYYARGLSSSAAKLKIVELMREYAPYPLGESVPSAVAKFSLSYWHPD